MCAKLISGDSEQTEEQEGEAEAKFDEAPHSEECAPDAGITDQGKTESDTGRSTEG
jgi:hypothetical protein